MTQTGASRNSPISLSRRRARRSHTADVTWGDLIGAYDAHLAAGNRSTGTRELRRFHLWALADRVADPLTVTIEDVEDWLANPDWSQNTRRSHRTTVVGFFRWCKAAGIRTDDPTALLLTIPGVIGKPRPCPEQALRKALMAADERARLMLALGAGVGLVRLHTRRQSCIVIYMSNEMSTGLVTMNDDAMDAWLGPVGLTDEQRDRFTTIWDDVTGRYPDDQDAATAALSAAVQYLVGETRPEDAGREIARLTASLEDARAAARVVAVLAIADGESENALAARMGVTRMTVRKWIGKG